MNRKIELGGPKEKNIKQKRKKSFPDKTARFRCQILTNFNIASAAIYKGAGCRALQ